MLAKPCRRAACKVCSPEPSLGCTGATTRGGVSEPNGQGKAVAERKPKLQVNDERGKGKGKGKGEGDPPQAYS